MEAALQTDILKEKLLNSLLPSFWKCFDDSNESPQDMLNYLLISINNLLREINSIQHPLVINTRWDDSTVYQSIRLCIGLTAPDVVYSVMKCVVSHSLSVERNSNYWNNFMSFVHVLKSIDLLESFLTHSVAVTIETKVNDYILTQCTGIYDQSLVGGVIRDMNKLLNDWLMSIYGDVSNEWSYRILYYIYTAYGQLRISELFDIIVDYPDCLPVLEDIKECLNYVNIRHELMNTLTQVYKRRLLHHGANTAVIITQYISSIKSLKIIDSTGVILEKVCDPVKSYLRSRDDTVTCIMASLIDDTSNDLSEELAKGESVLLDFSDDNENSLQDFDSWYPDPVDADQSKSSKSRQTSDVISLLVHIYGSQEIFINEYRSLLADRLLMTLDYDINKELRNLELLKLRFGESNLHYCEVMVKDITDSRRINTLITGKLGDNINGVYINLFILSHVFWPSFKQDTIKLPPYIQSVLNEYNKCYQEIKGMRQLEWSNTLGSVQLELQINEHVKEYTVTPPRACIIYMYQKQSTWSVDELCRELETVPSLVRRHLLYWVSQCVLYEVSTDTFTILTTSEHDNDDRGVVDEECHMMSLEDQKENDLQVIWSYVSAMLTNLGPLSIDKIHNMLKMFMMQEGGVVSINELKGHLDKKIKSQELIFINGTYQLNIN